MPGRLYSLPPKHRTLLPARSFMLTAVWPPGSRVELRHLSRLRGNSKRDDSHPITQRPVPSQRLGHFLYGSLPRSVGNEGIFLLMPCHAVWKSGRFFLYFIFSLFSRLSIDDSSSMGSRGFWIHVSNTGLNYATWYSELGMEQERAHQPTIIPFVPRATTGFGFLKPSTHS